jgi:AAA family ATP:ADP antiporter
MAERGDSDAGQVQRERRSGIRRSAILFTNFFLIILAYYQIKPASRSVAIEFVGADNLPFIWIGTALVLGSIISFYHRLVERHRRVHLVLGTCLTFIAVLIIFHLILDKGGRASAVAFYIFVDIFSVVLVEQFWSLTNTIYTTKDGKKWYGFVATGGLVGGVVAGYLASQLLEQTPLRTTDLLLVSAAILVLIVGLNMKMEKLGLYKEVQVAGEPIVAAGDWRSLLENRYLLLIACMLLLAQLIQPIVEYQFIKAVEATYQELDARTAFFSKFFSVLGLVSIAVNLGITPLVHRYLGVIAGLIAQPLALCIFSFGFWLQPTLLAASILKVGDRGLSYSINRASKELLYVPVDPVLTYQAKAWIDMFGYRLFKVAGSLVILLLTRDWLPVSASTAQLSWLTVGAALLWLAVIGRIAQEYREFPTTAAGTA